MTQRIQHQQIGPIAAAVAVGCVVVAIGLVAPSEAAAQDIGDQRAIELETIEIEAEVPRRVAQFFVQRDRLQYEQMEDRPSFLPELIDSVDEEPF